MDESLEFLDKLGIKYELVEHGAVFTIDDAMNEPALKGRTEIKNLFIQDDKGKRQYLVLMPGLKKLNMKELAVDLGEKKIRFCSEKKVQAMLGVKPGSVSLFCCLNPKSAHVKVIVDKDLVDGSLAEVGFHPIVNTATVFVAPGDMSRILGGLTQQHEVLSI